MASINEKLTRIDESISNLKEELKLDKTTEIEEIQQTLSARKEIIIDEQNEDGYATAITIKGFDKIPFAAFGVSNYSVDSNSHVGAYLCSKYLTKVNILEGTTVIERAAFRASIIKEVSLPETLTLINTDAFCNCRSLSNIKRIPDNVTTISSGAFYVNYSMTQISMKNVTELNGAYSGKQFGHCTALKAAWIGSAITKMADIFYNCTSLQKIFIDLPKATVETFSGYKTFFTDNSNTTVSIICNDDEGFISQEEFDAIDWSTYTE